MFQGNLELTTQELATQRTVMASERTRLANERTLVAWVRTGLAVTGFGAEVAFAFQLSSKLIGLIMAICVGGLIASISFELVLPSAETAGALRVSLGLLTGALAFFAGDLLIVRLGGEGRKSSDGPEEESSGLGIVLGTVLDGIPESAVLGMSLAKGDGVRSLTDRSLIPDRVG